MDKVDFYNDRSMQSCVSLTPDELGKRLGYQHSETLGYTKAEQSRFKQDVKKPGLGVLSQAMYSALCHQHDLEHPFKDVALVDLGAPAGVCAVATKKIPALTVLGLYCGDYAYSDSASNDPYIFRIGQVHKDLVISANKRGGMARFLAHLPPQEEADRMVFLDRSVVAEVAHENVFCVCQIINNVPVILLQVGHHAIEKGHLLGWDYGTEYWNAVGITPSLFSKGRQLIPPSSYKRTGAVDIGCFRRSTGGKRSEKRMHMTCKADVFYEQLYCDPNRLFWEAIDRASGRLCVFSLYDAIDALVEANALPADYGRLTQLDGFAEQFQRALRSVPSFSASDMSMACYWQNPKAVVEGSWLLEDYAVDAVLQSFSSQHFAELERVLAPIIGLGFVVVCKPTGEFKFVASNDSAVADKLHMYVTQLLPWLLAVPVQPQSLETSGCAHVASLACLSASSALKLEHNREIQHQVLACPASMFAVEQAAPANEKYNNFTEKPLL